MSEKFGSVDVTPEEFASREEMGTREGWAGSAKKTKKVRSYISFKFLKIFQNFCVLLAEKQER